VNELKIGRPSVWFLQGWSTRHLLARGEIIVPCGR